MKLPLIDAITLDIKEIEGGSQQPKVNNAIDRFRSVDAADLKRIFLSWFRIPIKKRQSCGLLICKSSAFFWSVLWAGNAAANGLGSGSSWQFSSSADAANKASVAAIISKERAGAFGPGGTTITYDVKGNLNNCNLNATAIGNTGSNSQTAPIGSPTLELGSTVNAGSTGNEANNSTTGGDSSATNVAGGMVESASGIGDSTTQAPSNSTALNSTQANTGSQLSTIGSVSAEYAVAGVSGSGGDGQANLNATQTVANTELSSSVQGSSACQFQDMTGNLASPINSATSVTNQ